MATSPQAKAAEYPKPDVKVLSLDQLEPGDILLSRGDSHISDLIVEADHGSFSHAALYTGSSIIESTLKDGIQEHAPTGLRYVYRYCYDPKKPTKLSQKEAESVVAAARKQVGNKYDTAEIHLLAVVFQKCWPLGRPRKSLADAILDTLGGTAAKRLKTWLQEVYGRSAPRICTELVALSYYQADKPLRVPPLDKRTAAPAPSAAPEKPAAEAVDQMATLERNVTQALWEDDDAVKQVAANLKMGEAETRGFLYGVLAEDSVTGNPVSVVTPADLQFSPSLQCVGILDATQAKG